MSISTLPDCAVCTERPYPGSLVFPGPLTCKGCERPLCTRHISLHTRRCSTCDAKLQRADTTERYQPPPSFPHNEKENT